MFNNHNNLAHPKRTLGQKSADKIAEWGGSWGFLIFLSSVIGLWVIFNLSAIFIWHWDPYPFILLNLFLSCLSAYQAPIILMAQNRSAERDRHKAERDYAVNRKAEREVENMQQDLDEIKESLKQHHLWLKEQHASLNQKLKKPI